MRLAGLALNHPAAEVLLDYAMNGCPVKAGHPWTRTEMGAAVERGPHVLALEPAVMQQLLEEVTEKEAMGPVGVIEWESIKDDPMEELKISPIAMISHKLRR